MSSIGVCTACLVLERIIGCYVGDDASRICEDCYGPGMVRYYEIPSDNMGELARRFATLAKRAKKLKLPEPTFREIGEPTRKEKKHPVTGLTEKVYLLHHIVVDPGLSEVKVTGWTFIATVQCTEEGNIIRKVGQAEVPAEYRTITNKCDHCSTSRNRKDVYLLHHEKDGYKVVGRNCLIDYFGTDALMYAERAQYLADLSDSIEDDEFGFGGGGGGPKYYALEDYLSHVAQCIKLEGWMSRGRARKMDGYVQATADIAYLHMTPSARPPKWHPLYSVIDLESFELAEKAIEWAADLEGEEIADYLHNIRVIARRAVCEGRDMGLGASIVSAYQRHLNSLRMKELAARRGEVATHVGTVGDRSLFNLHVENVITCDGQYGTSYLHILGDKDMNCFKWFSSGTTLETGKDYLLKGTIKKHDEYRGVKQNLLSRCEEVEIKSYLCVVEGVKFELSGETELDVRKQLREKLNVKKLPRGTFIVEQVQEVEGAV